ncbi:hypothetical protein SUDANB58_04731 [Streptomyces sp. enrichment culture]
MTGWFSFPDGEATAGDVPAPRRVEDVPRGAGAAHDVVRSSGFRAAGPHFEGVDPAAYPHLSFVCGPVRGPQVEEAHRRFAHCARTAVGVSAVGPGPRRHRFRPGAGPRGRSRHGRRDGVRAGPRPRPARAAGGRGRRGPGPAAGPERWWGRSPGEGRERARRIEAGFRADAPFDGADGLAETPGPALRPAGPHATVNATTADRGGDK